MNTGAGRDPAEGLVRTIRARGVRDPRVLEAFRRVRREGFVPPELAGLAYRDEPIPIPHGQVTSQPSLIAQMVAALRLTGSERVLEVGTGYGYQTAILAALAREVFSIERFADLAERARSNLERAGIDGVTVLVGDGTLASPSTRRTTASSCRPPPRRCPGRSPGSSRRAAGSSTPSARAVRRS